VPPHNETQNKNYGYWKIGRNGLWGPRLERYGWCYGMYTLQIGKKIRELSPSTRKLASPQACKSARDIPRGFGALAEMPITPDARRHFSDRQVFLFL